MLEKFPAPLQSNPRRCHRVSQPLVVAEQFLGGDSTYIIFTTSEAIAPVQDPRDPTRSYMGYRSFGNSADRDNDDLQPKLRAQSQPQLRATPPL